MNQEKPGNVIPTNAGWITAEQLMAMPDDGNLYELIEGELRMMPPPGARHGRVAFTVAGLLSHHLRGRQLGTAYAAETGFLLSRNPDTVRAPDLAFVHRERLRPFPNAQGYLPLAPDFVAEVMSPSDRWREVEEKAQAWIEAGSQVALVVDPSNRTLHVFRPNEVPLVLDDHCEFDAGNAVPGWKFHVTELLDDSQ